MTYPIVMTDDCVTMTGIPMSKFDRNGIFIHAGEFGRKCLDDYVSRSKWDKTHAFIAVKEGNRNYSIDVYLLLKGIKEMGEVNNFPREEMENYMRSHKKWRKTGCKKEVFPFLYVHVDINNILTRSGRMDLMIAERDEDLKKASRREVKNAQEEASVIYKDTSKTTLLVNTLDKGWKAIPIPTKE